jgi:hypothetical protein
VPRVSMPLWRAVCSPKRALARLASSLKLATLPSEPP